MGSTEQDSFMSGTEVQRGKFGCVTTGTEVRQRVVEEVHSSNPVSPYSAQHSHFLMKTFRSCEIISHRNTHSATDRWPA